MKIYSWDVSDLQSWQPDSNWWKLVLYTDLSKRFSEKTEVDNSYTKSHKSFEGFRKKKYSHVQGIPRHWEETCTVFDAYNNAQN